MHVDGGVSDLVPISGAADLAPTRVFVLDASVPARAPQGRTPIDVLVASLGVATRVRPEPDLGPGVTIHRMTTPDLGARMTDFSLTAQHIADGRVAADRLVRELETASAPASTLTRTTTIRLRRRAA
jgi:NTE family protein